MPFGNIVSQVKVSGNEIYAMFEHSLRSMHVTNDAGEVILDENGFLNLVLTVVSYKFQIRLKFYMIQTYKELILLQD